MFTMGVLNLKARQTRQLFLISFLLLVIGLYVWLNLPENRDALWTLGQTISSADQQPDSGQAGSRLTDVALPSVLNVPPAQMRSVLAETYRLRPDNRFLLAVAEIHRFLTGQQKKTVTIEFQSGVWLVRHGGTQVGALPEFPDFSQGMDLLVGWARTVGWDHPVCLIAGTSGLQSSIGDRPLTTESYWCGFPWRLATKTTTPEQVANITRQLDQFWAPHAAAAARQVDALWSKGVRDAALLQAATRAMVYLNLQVLDRMDTADHLAAKALAILALTKGLTQIPVTHEESLLAEIMGYGAHALRTAQILPESDPVRSFITHDDKRLEPLAQSPEATAETRYLWLLRLAALEDVRRFSSAVNSLFPQDWLSLPILKAGLSMDAFEISPALSEALPPLVLLTIAQEVGMPDLMDIVNRVRTRSYSDEELRILTNSVEAILSAETSTLVSHFESGLSILDQYYKGPFLDSETYQAYYRAYFFSALYILGLHYLDSLSSGKAAERFASTLGNTRTGTAGDFRRWYHNLVRSKAGKGDLSRLIEDLMVLSHFGATPLFRTFEEQKDHFSYGDPAILRAVKLMVSRMDTRVGHRVALANAAYYQLMDIRLAERLYRTVAETAPFHEPYAYAMYALITGNHKLLLELLHEPGFKPEARAYILRHLEKFQALSAEILRAEYKRLIDEEPNNWRVAMDVVEYLERVKDYPAARAVAADWLARDVTTAGLEHFAMVSAIARLFYLEGRYQEGWKTIEPIIQSQKEDVMSCAALLLDKMGRTEDAEKMARFALDRYPDSLQARTLLLQILWRHGKYSEAATVIKSSPYKINFFDWQLRLGERFAEVFLNRPPEQGLEAFSALIAEGFDPIALRSLAVLTARGGNHELAFKMVSQLRMGSPGDLNFLLRAYTHLKAWQGQAKALEWLRRNVPPQLVSSSGLIIFTESEYDLLWDFIGSPVGSGADFVWLMRAAASIKLGLGNDPHHEQLVQHFTKAGQGPYHTAGRYLMGLASEQEVFALATDANTRCEIAYYVGLRANGEGRYEDASDWYRASVETGLINHGAYRWSHSTLQLWQSKGKSLPRLATEEQSSVSHL